jgi:hypothetical protein
MRAGLNGTFQMPNKQLQIARFVLLWLVSSSKARQLTSLLATGLLFISNFSLWREPFQSKPFSKQFPIERTPRTRICFYPQKRCSLVNRAVVRENCSITPV